MLMHPTPVPRRPRPVPLLASIAAVLAAAGTCTAQDAAAPAAATAPPAAPEGLVPLIDYTGDIGTRSRLLGDWGGSRTDLAHKGIMLDIDWTQAVQGVVAGGRRIDWDYTGSLDLAMTVDLHRMGVLPGAVIEARAEGRYGESVNDDSGMLLPVNTDAFFPLTSPLNDNIFSVTELNYTQFLGPKFALTLGKYQTLDGDPNEFASGRGRSQFMNFNFIANSVTALTVPYSTIGGGVVVLPTDHITLSSIIVTTTDSSTTSGFENTDDGWSWISEAQFQYDLAGLPGGANLGGTYAFDGDFAQLGGKYQLIPTQGLVLPADSHSWCVYASAWQYVWTAEKPPARINTSNGVADVRGVGVFARLGFGDPDTNPTRLSVSAGLGARGVIPSRANDTCGVAYVYSDLQDARRLISLALEDSTDAFEAYYSIAFTPAVNLSLDFQWTAGAFRALDDAAIVGLRLDIRF